MRDFDATANLRDAAVRTLQVREQFPRNPKKSTERAYQGIGTSRGKSSYEFDGHADRLSADDARDAALRYLEHRSSELSNDQGDQVDKLIRERISEDNPNLDGSYIAKRMLITESPAYRSAFSEILSQSHPMLSQEETAAIRSFRELERTAMAEGAGPTGQFGIPVFIDPSIILSAQGSTNQVFDMARKVQVTTNLWKGVSSAGVTWSFDAEASTVSDDSPILAQPTVTVFTARGFIPYSLEIGMDYPGFAQEMSTLLAEGYSELSTQKLVVGSGTGEPLGISTALVADTTVQVTTAATGTIAGADVNKAWEKLPERYKGRANWLTSYGASDIISSLGNSNNASFFTGDMTGVLMTLRTKPVRTTSYIPDLVSGTTTPVAAIVGDFSNYVVAVRAGLNVEPIPMLFDQSNGNRPTGQRGLFAWSRIGAASVNNKGFVLLVNHT
jgi:HK97 family phage major capsid protein